MTVTQTSMESYMLLGEVQREHQKAVLEVIRERGPLSDRQTARILRWSINRVVPRRNELVLMGHVKAVGHVYDGETLRNVTAWGIA